MFSVLLELPEFEVVNQEIFPTHYVVHVEKKAEEERCPQCGFHSSIVHDKRTRKVRDLSVLNKPLYLMICIKRYRCQNCEEVFSSSFESVASHQHHTQRFRLFVYEQVLGTTIQDISRKYQIAYSTVERIFYSVAQEKANDHQTAILEIQDDQDITLSLDEIAVRKGHKYETVLYDANLGAVLGMHQNRDFDSTIELLSSKIIHPAQVKNVVVDMWDPFHKAIRTIFPNAQIIVDKYHVVQKVTQALDQVRKKIPRGEIALPNFQLIPFSVDGITEKTLEVPRGVRMIRARSIWREGYKGENIVVAVIDTGCQPDHPDLINQIVGGYNFTGDYYGNPANFADNNGHGTHVCRIIAAAENGFGVVGAAPKAKLLVLKALNGSGEGTTDNISSAIQYAINWTGPRGEKVRVINMSLGGPSDDPALHSSIKNAVQANIMVVCAAGNEGDGIADTIENSYPAAYPEVVAVGSVNQRGRISRFSNSNGEVDLVAPGEQVVSTFPGNQFAVLSGTSMAVPHVSGAVALLIDKYETIRGHKLTELEAYNELLNQTVSLGNPETQEGHGLLKLNHQKVEKLIELLRGISLHLENR